jgi:hypothetical protein
VTPEQRRLRAQLAANTRWSRPMAREDQADAARAAIYARLQREVDPQGKLSPDERGRRVHSAARALSAKMNSAKARERLRRRRDGDHHSPPPSGTGSGADDALGVMPGAILL